jgi:hypothetical protein
MLISKAALEEQQQEVVQLTLKYKQLKSSTGMLHFI